VKDENGMNKWSCAIFAFGIAMLVGYGISTLFF